MVVTERQIHHWSNLYLTVHSHGARHDFVHAKNSALRRIQNRGGEERSVHSAVGDRKRAALQVFDLEFSNTRSRGIIGDVTFELGKALLIHIAHDRHNESTLGADGDTDIAVIVLNKVITVDATVDYGYSFERFHACFNEEGHQTEFDAVLFRELVLPFPAQFLDGDHVAFIERRKN